jgi:hypothetical protein
MFPELGYSGASFNLIFPPTKNPWNTLDHDIVFRRHEILIDDRPRRGPDALGID